MKVSSRNFGDIIAGVAGVEWRVLRATSPQTGNAWGLAALDSRHPNRKARVISEPSFSWTAPLQVVAINHKSLWILRLTRSPGTRLRVSLAGGGVDDACACAFRLRVKRLYGNGFGISRRTKVALSN
jgi:hypothetical protein